MRENRGEGGMLVGPYSVFLGRSNKKDLSSVDNRTNFAVELEIIGLFINSQKRNCSLDGYENPIHRVSMS